MPDTVVNGTIARYTEKDFLAFHAEVRRLQNLLGLYDWDIRVEFAATTPDADRHDRNHAPLATCENDAQNRVAVLTLDSEHQWRARPSPVALARHEMGHVLFAHLQWLGECRFVNDGEFDVEVERLCNTLEHLIRSSEARGQAHGEARGRAHGEARGAARVCKKRSR